MPVDDALQLQEEVGEHDERAGLAEPERELVHVDVLPGDLRSANALCESVDSTMTIEMPAMIALMKKKMKMKGVYQSGWSFVGARRKSEPSARLVHRREHHREDRERDERLLHAPRGASSSRATRTSGTRELEEEHASCST